MHYWKSTACAIRWGSSLVKGKVVWLPQTRKSYNLMQPDYLV